MNFGPIKQLSVLITVPGQR